MAGAQVPIGQGRVARQGDDVLIVTWANGLAVIAEGRVVRRGDPVPFIPFSSLDIRKRGVIREILSLLLFLDSPPDDLSFASFLLGRVLSAKTDRDGPAFARGDWHRFLFDCRRAKASPLYVALRKRHPGL